MGINQEYIDWLIVCNGCCILALPIMNNMELSNDRFFFMLAKSWYKAKSIRMMIIDCIESRVTDLIEYVHSVQHIKLYIQQSLN